VKVNTHHSYLVSLFFHLKQISEAPEDKTTHQINAFQLIGMASSLDLSGFFEEEVWETSWKFLSSTVIALLKTI